MIKLVDEMTNAIDNSKFTLGVFIDLKKAFDTINRGAHKEKFALARLARKFEFALTRAILHSPARWLM